MKIERRFTFRGERKYLHSTSLLNDLAELRREAADRFDFRFSRKTANQVSYQDAAPGETARLVATWQDRDGSLFVVEGDEPMLEATAYDEAKLMQQVPVDGRTAHIPDDIGTFTRMEALVTAFKHLLQIVNAETPRKYVFVRLRLDRQPKGACSVTYARDIGEFFQGDIREDGAVLGQIFFGAWK